MATTCEAKRSNRLLSDDRHVFNKKLEYAQRNQLHKAGDQTRLWCLNVITFPSIWWCDRLWCHYDYKSAHKGALIQWVFPVHMCSTIQMTRHILMLTHHTRNHTISNYSELMNDHCKKIPLQKSHHLHKGTYMYYYSSEMCVVECLWPVKLVSKGVWADW